MISDVSALYIPPVQCLLPDQILLYNKAPSRTVEIKPTVAIFIISGLVVEPVLLLPDEDVDVVSTGWAAQADLV